MILIQIHPAAPRWNMPASQLAALQLLTTQQPKPILFSFPDQPCTAFFQSPEDPSLAVFPVLLRHLFCRRYQQIKSPDLPLLHGIQPGRQISLSRKMHTRQQAFPIHRSIGIEIDCQCVPVLTDPIDYTRTFPIALKKPHNHLMKLLAVAQCLPDYTLLRNQVNFREIQLVPPW